jgi:hypothetical protein
LHNQTALPAQLWRYISQHLAKFADPSHPGRPCNHDQETRIAANQLMVSVTVVECEMVPSLPVTVRVKVPLLTLLVVLIVIVVLPDVMTLLGVKLALANFGKPLTEKETVPE